MSRTTDRKDRDQLWRITSLEDDVDRLEAEASTFDSRLSKTTGIIVGLLISVATAAIILALQLGIGGK